MTAPANHLVAQGGAAVVHRVAEVLDEGERLRLACGRIVRPWSSYHHRGYALVGPRDQRPPCSACARSEA